jgi:hypothetical protein
MEDMNMKNIFKYILNGLAKFFGKKPVDVELFSVIEKPEKLSKEDKEEVLEELSDCKKNNNDLRDFVSHADSSTRREVCNKLLDQRMTSHRLCFLLAWIEEPLNLAEWEKFFQRLVDKPTNKNIGCIIKYIEPSIREEVVQKLADRIKEIEEQETRDKDESDE